MEPLVSVIIPVYNVENYIKKCVLSIIAQTYTNLEIILIDDGSTDNSGLICDEIAAIDERVIVIHQINHGLSIARNYGLDISTGKWVYFIDSDDWAHQNLIETLLSLAEKYAADISVCNSIDVNEKGNQITKVINSGKEYIFHGEEIIFSLINPTLNIRFEVWNKLWKRSLIKDVRFIEGQVSEDIHFDRILFLKARKVVYYDCGLHYYRTERPGNTNSSFKLKRFCVFDEYKEWIKDLKKLNYNESVGIVALIASNTAAGLYYAAKLTQQDKKIYSQLITEFKYFYQYVINTSYCTNKIKLFHYSPQIYCIISKLYKVKYKGKNNEKISKSFSKNT